MRFRDVVVMEGYLNSVALDHPVVRYRLSGTSGTPSKPGKRQSLDPAPSRGKARRR